MTEPSTEFKVTRGMQIMLAMVDRGPMTSREICDIVGGLHQTVSSRCHALEIMGLLDARQRMGTDRKEYKLSSTARALLRRRDRAEILTAVTRQLKEMTDARARKLKAEKDEWTREMKANTRLMIGHRVFWKK